MQCHIFSSPENNSIALKVERLYLGRYYPWCGGHNPNFNKFSGLILDVKEQRQNGI